MRQVFNLLGMARAASLAWNNNHHFLTVGNCAGMIVNIDNCMAARCIARFVGHKGEVCGLAWNLDGSYLASSSNDDTVCLWNASSFSSCSARSNRGSAKPDFVLKEHTGAVKALAWCPFWWNMLASGGGSSDHTIKVWNAALGSLLLSTDTGSQVSSLLWGKEVCDLYLGHGFTDNNIVAWHIPMMT